MEQSWIIGRSTDCDLVILDKKVSGRHCRLTPQTTAHSFMLEDLGSSNGTYVNGTKVGGPTEVKPTDQVLLGRRVTIPWALITGSAPDGTITIRKSPDDEVVFEESLVPGGCARLLLFGDVVVLEDVGCPHGVSLGSPERKVKRAVLDPSDTFYVGSQAVEPKSWSAAVEGVRAAKNDVEQASASQERDAALSRREEVGRKIVELGVLSKQDWDSAVQTADPTTSLEDILHKLEKSKRTGPSGDMEPIVTSFQADKILTDQADELRIGDYVVRDPLGRGGMGEVFRGRSLDGKLDVAIKVLTKVVSELKDEDAHRRFLREARLLERLAHTTFTKFYGSGERNGEPYIVMEFLQGKTIDGIVKDGIAANEKSPVDWTIDAAMIIADALDHAHKNNVIHRDIKPTNIMVTREGKLKLVDLGIGRLVGMAQESNATIAAPLTQQGTGLGTPEYMAPEQWKDATQVTPATDIYSLGCTFFFLLAARPPYQGSLRDLLRGHAFGPPPSIRQYRPDVPRKLDKVLRKMMAISPSDRYTSAAELVQDLGKSKQSGFPWKTIAIATAATVVLAAIAGVSLWLLR